MLPKAIIEKVLSQAQASAAYSWEYGTIFEALLEYHYPKHTVFQDPFPNNSIPTLKFEDNLALQYIKPFINTDSPQLSDGKGSTADPTSLAIPALLLAKSLPSSPYHSAVTRHLHTLLDETPHFANGALSHRSAYPSLWADFIYMVPPFLAYHGATSADLELVKESIRQCERYCDVLRTESGCWKHIANDEGVEVGDGVKSDDGLWSTGNVWAAAGMGRVVSTVRRSEVADETKDGQSGLVGMIKGIIDGAMGFDNDASGLLRNRLDDEAWFGEAAGTALLAATCFRMAVVEPQVFGAKYVDWAERKMLVVEECVDRDTGVVAPVVNPTRDTQRTPLDGVSPEAQAFVVLMYSAWRDWTEWKSAHGTL